ESGAPTLRKAVASSMPISIRRFSVAGPMPGKTAEGGLVRCLAELRFMEFCSARLLSTPANPACALVLFPDSREDAAMKGTAKTHASTAMPTGSSPWKTALSWLSGLLILAGVVAVALHFTELKKLAELAQKAQPAWLLLAVILQAATYFAAAGAWWIVLKRTRQPRRYLDMVPLGLAKLFVDQALPTGGVGGTLLVVSGLHRRGVPKGISMAALLIGMISFYAAYLIAVAFAFAILFLHGALNSLLIAGTGIFVVIALAVPLGVLLVRRWVRVWPLSLLVKLLPALGVLVEAMEEAPAKTMRDPVALGVTGLFQFSVFLLDAATLWTVLHAIGSPASP